MIGSVLLLMTLIWLYKSLYEAIPHIDHEPTNLNIIYVYNYGSYISIVILRQCSDYKFIIYEGVLFLKPSTIVLNDKLNILCSIL